MILLHTEKIMQEIILYVLANLSARPEAWGTLW